MFTGIIQAVGTITAVDDHHRDCSISFDCHELAGQRIELGDSIALNGCCLTVVEIQGSIIKVDVSSETLNRTTLHACHLGLEVNLELAMQPQTRFGGHIVSGHVDGLATVTAIESDGRSIRYDFGLNHSGRYLAEKGSVTVDGVSLTVNSVCDVDAQTVFSVNIIPHTLENTIFSNYAVGSTVHIEVDMIARYLERINQYDKRDA